LNLHAALDAEMIWYLIHPQDMLFLLL